MKRTQQTAKSFDECNIEIHALPFRMKSEMTEKELIEIIKSNVKANLAALIFATKVDILANLKAKCKGAEKWLAESRQRSRHANEVSFYD